MNILLHIIERQAINKNIYTKEIKEEINTSSGELIGGCYQKNGRRYKSQVTLRGVRSKCDILITDKYSKTDNSEIVTHTQTRFSSCCQS